MDPDNDDFCETRGDVRVSAKPDFFYSPRFHFNDERLNREAEEEERKQLDRGFAVALIYTVETFCPHCARWTVEEVVHGCVVNKQPAAIADLAESFFKEHSRDT